MARLSEIIHTSFSKTIVEAEAEAPVEETPPAEEPAPAEAEPTEEPVDGTEADATAEEPTEEETTPEEVPAEEPTPEEPEENFDDADKNMEKMVGMVDIAHTSSSTTIDFEDGGQLMYVQPMISLQSDTLTEIMNLIIKDVKKTYAGSKDEITGKDLKNTKYWDSVKALIGTMVRSQLTKSDNMDGLVDEIKQVFKILEVK